MRIHIPTKAAVDSVKPPVRFVIVARSANFAYRVEQRAGHMTPGHVVSTPGGSMSTGGTVAGGGRSKVIVLTMSFMVWDYRTDAPVSYGKFTSQMSASYFFTQGEWTGMMERAARYIVQHLP